MIITSSYNDLLLRSSKCTMHVARQRLLCIEIFKTLNHLNPPFMQSIFELRSSTYSLRNANNLAHFRPNQTTFGSKSLKSFGPQIWNGLPSELKSAENLRSFKVLIKNGTVPTANVASVLAYQLLCKFRKSLFCFFTLHIRS